MFGLHPLMTCAVLGASVLLAGMCARAAGETDIAPIGPIGMLTQIAVGTAGAAGSIMSGAIVSGAATSTAQAMWAFKTGHRLKASMRSQVVALVLGAVVGSLVVVPVYLLITQAYTLGSERMPAVAALSWKATAEAVTGGLSGLPMHGLRAATIGFVVASGLCVLQRTKAAGFVPSPMAMGIGMIMPVSMSAAALLGAGMIAVGRRRIASLGEGESNALAAGLLAGESVIGVVIAGLVAAGVLRL